MILTPFRSYLQVPVLVRLVTGLLLVIAVADLPYPYYQVLRVVVCGVAGYTAYSSWKQGQQGWAWIFGFIAVLFNPLIPVELMREAWMVIDLAAAAIFFTSAVVLVKGRRA
jgi:hypothetical protein